MTGPAGPPAMPIHERIRQSARGGWLRQLRTAGTAVAERWPFPWPVRIGERTIYVDLRSSIGRGLVMTGDFDPAVTACIVGRLSPGGTFIDVGANIGWYSFRAAQVVGREGRVLAVEVDSRALRCLQRTAHRNRDLPIDIAAIAADQADGFAHLRMATECGHSVLSASNSDRLVPTRTLDSLVKSRRYTRVDLLKIDVEGAELRVLKGATGLLRQFRPSIVCELISDNLAEQGDSAERLSEFLAELSYSIAPLPGVWSPTIVCDARPG